MAFASFCAASRFGSLAQATMFFSPIAAAAHHIRERSDDRYSAARMCGKSRARSVGAIQGQRSLGPVMSTLNLPPFASASASRATTWSLVVGWFSSARFLPCTGFGSRHRIPLPKSTQPGTTRAARNLAHQVSPYQVVDTFRPLRSAATLRQQHNSVYAAPRQSASTQHHEVGCN